MAGHTKSIAWPNHDYKKPDTREHPTQENMRLTLAEETPEHYPHCTSAQSHGTIRPTHDYIAQENV